MKSLAQIAREDKSMMKGLYRNYHFTPSEAKMARRQEVDAHRFRQEGRLENVEAARRKFKPKTITGGF